MQSKGNNEIKSSAHSKYRCQYHIVFAPKYRRQVIYGQIKKDIGEIIRKLCEQKGVEIIEAEACKDHIHLLVSIPPHLSVAQFMGYLKGKSSLMIFDTGSVICVLLLLTFVLFLNIIFFDYNYLNIALGTGGKIMLALNIYSLICACIGCGYGISILLKYKKTPPLYFKLLVFAIASMVFTRAFYTVALLCYGDELKTIFNIGFLGFGTFFMFIFFVNVGAIDSLVDSKKKRFTKYRLLPVILPTAELVIALVALFSDHASIAIRIIYVLLSLLAGAAGYFNLKHLIIFDIKGGIVDSIRKFNLLCILLEILILSEVGLYCYGLESLTIVAEILIGILYILFLPILYKGVKKWNQ